MPRFRRKTVLSIAIKLAAAALFVLLITFPRTNVTAIRFLLPDLLSSIHTLPKIDKYYVSSIVYAVFHFISI